MQEFGEKSDDLAGVFNSCCVLGRAKCGVYKPKLGIYTPRVMGRGTLVHSLGSMNPSPMISQQLLAASDPETFSLRGKTEDNNDEMW